MKFVTVGTIVLCLSILAAGSGLAESGVPYVRFVTQPNTEEVSLFILPDATGAPFSAAVLLGGTETDARITVQLVDVNGIVPIPNFPAEDMWLSSELATAHSCLTWGFTAESNTDDQGYTTFTMPLPGGGWSDGPLWFYLNGNKASHPLTGELPPLAMRFNSADISGNGSVDLADVPLFADDYYGAYAYRSDFNWDGALNLSDVTKMAISLGSSCP